MKLPLKILFGGDLLLDPQFAHECRQSNGCSLAPFGPLASSCEPLDLLVVNFEGPIAGEIARLRKSVLLQNDPSILDWIPQGPVCICNLGNNHIMDFGVEALNRTRDSLKARGILCLGAGLSEKEAGAELIISHNGWKIGALSFTSSEDFVGAQIAHGDNPGCCDWRPQESALEKVRSLARLVDCLIVQLHVGREFFEYPSPDQVRFSRDLVSAGANFVVGHHPHLVQGMEKFPGAAIFYSLGHFYVSPFRDAEGFLKNPGAGAGEFFAPICSFSEDKKATVTIVGGKWGEEGKLDLYSDGSHKSFVAKIDRLSTPVSSANYESFWRQYSAQRPVRLKRDRWVNRLVECFTSPSQSMRRVRKRFSEVP